MRISKFLPIICAATFCAALSPARAVEDNPAQAAARAALLQEMQADNAGMQPAQTNAPVLIDAPGVVAEPTNQPPAMMMTPGNSNAVAPAMTTSDTDAQAKARAALLQEMPNPSTSSGMTNSDVMPMPSPQSELTSSENEKAHKEAAAAEKKRLADEAWAEKKAEREAKKAAEKSPALSQPMSNSMTNMELNPMEAPPLPISATKEERLQALDAKYKADQISPQEYFKQREEILGGQ